MKSPNTIWVISALAVALALGGCSSKGGAQGDGTGMGGPGAGLNGGAGGPGGPKINRYGSNQGDMYGNNGMGGPGGANGGGYGYNGRGGATGDPELDDPSSPLSKRIVYFHYDSYEVLPEYQSVVSAHANYLAAHPDRNVVLEGHADERGSPDYNVALSEQRAQAVARMMQLQGATNGQIRVVSYGEEKPAVPGHDESAWQQNRRVEISYAGGR